MMTASLRRRNVAIMQGDWKASPLSIWLRPSGGLPWLMNPSDEVECAARDMAQGGEGRVFCIPSVAPQKKNREIHENITSDEAAELLHHV